MKRKKIVIIYNQNENPVREEEQDTEISAREIEKVLLQTGYQVELFPVTKNNLKEKWDFKNLVVLNLVEWTGSDTGYAVRAFKKLEKCGAVFTGCNARAHLINSDKVMIKTLLDKNYIKTPRWQVIGEGVSLDESFIFPVIIKPIDGHCSEGINDDSVKLLPEEVGLFENRVLAEEFIEGREVQATVIEKKGELVVLPPAEIIFGDYNRYRILTYKSKWDDTSEEFKGLRVKSAELTANTEALIITNAKKCFKIFGARDYARVDFRIRGEEVFTLELNTNPEIDFTPQGGMGWSARSAGLNYSGFLELIIENCIHRFDEAEKGSAEYAIQ